MGSIEKKSWQHRLKDKEVWRTGLVALFVIAILPFVANGKLSTEWMCRLGSAATCRSIASAIIHDMDFTPEAYRYLKLACKYNDDSSCIEVAAYAFRGRQGGVVDSEVHDMLVASCFAEHPAVCAHLPKFTRDPVILKKSLLIVERRCRDSPGECSLVPDYYRHANDQINHVKAGETHCRREQEYCQQFFRSIYHHVEKTMALTELTRFCRESPEKFSEACKLIKILQSSK